MTDRELLQQVLDALNSCDETWVYDGEHEQIVDQYDHKLVAKALETLRARLSAPEPEPVAYAGCTVWIGNVRVTQGVAKLSLIHERNEGMSLTNAAQKCLYLIAKTMRGNNND
jgi:hypothetical protein